MRRRRKTNSRSPPRSPSSSRWRATSPGRWGLTWRTCWNRCPTPTAATARSPTGPTAARSTPSWKCWTKRIMSAFPPKSPPSGITLIRRWRPASSASATARIPASMVWKPSMTTSSRAPTAGSSPPRTPSRMPCRPLTNGLTTRLTATRSSPPSTPLSSSTSKAPSRAPSTSTSRRAAPRLSSWTPTPAVSSASPAIPTTT